MDSDTLGRRLANLEVDKQILGSYQGTSQLEPDGHPTKAKILILVPDGTDPSLFPKEVVIDGETVLVTIRGGFSTRPIVAL